ncbi:MAG: response regulator [Anaerolineae bacterium]|nr:response regulator [Anaerolineae bacterium]
MLHELRISLKADPDLASAAADLSKSTLRILIFTTGGICLAWYVVANFTNWWRIVPTLSYALIAVVIPSLFALRLIPKRLLAAQSIWVLGMTAAITLAIYLFRKPEIAFFYMLIPFVATIAITWEAGLLFEGVVIGLLWWLSQTQLAPSPFSTSGLIIVVGGGIAGALGWAVIHVLLTVTQWSLFSFEQTRREIEIAREQRVELKQTQEDLVQANQELARLADRLKVMHHVAEEARRAKEQFVANVSHELRTPLNMIIGFSDMIMQLPQVYGGALPQPLLADIAAIQRNSQHLAKLVDDVLDLSQIEAGHMTLSQEWVSLQEIIDEAAEAVGALFESKGLYLKAEIPPELAPVFCDVTRIRQVLINLLSNAGRFTERGGVVIKAKPEESAVVVSVTDTGPGIAPEEQQRLFQPFQQLDSSIRRRHGGSGLGLSISQQFVEMHGGKMWLESEVDVGTTIYFNLPLGEPLPAALNHTGDATRWFNPYNEYEYRLRTRQSKAPVPTVRPRLVLLEKGGTLQHLFGHHLPDFETVSVGDAEEAVCELNRSPAQALVVNMPLFREASIPINQLDELAYCTPALTCWVPGEDETARELGVVKYLIKPVSCDKLLSILEDLGPEVRTVLLVDDDQEVLRLFARMIAASERGYRILQAMGGQRALDLMRERQPDVVLLDLIMPGMDGFQVLQEKNRDPDIREIPVVVISSRDPSGDLVASDTLTVTCNGGLSVRNLAACVRAVSEILSPMQVASSLPGD